MEEPFKIKFDFPIANSDVMVSLSATAQLHHSIPYYIVEGFSFPNSKQGESVSVLPPQEVRLLKKGKLRIWVHKDSERESLLSQAIGKAIEESGNFVEE
jgi:hypothetical protein